MSRVDNWRYRIYKQDAAGAAGWEEREMNGLLINDNTLENSHYYMDNVVLHALNSQTPYSSNFVPWSLGLGAGMHRGARSSSEWKWIR